MLNTNTSYNKNLLNLKIIYIKNNIKYIYYSNIFSFKYVLSYNNYFRADIIHKIKMKVFVIILKN